MAPAPKNQSILPANAIGQVKTFAKWLRRVSVWIHPSSRVFPCSFAGCLLAWIRRIAERLGVLQLTGVTAACFGGLMNRACDVVTNGSELGKANLNGQTHQFRSAAAGEDGGLIDLGKKIVRDRQWNGFG